MFQILTILLSLITVILMFITHYGWAWLVIGIIDLYLLFVLWGAKRKYRFDFISEISLEANTLLKQYGHYFLMPFGAKDFSASAATVQFAGIAIAFIGVVKGAWLSLLFGFVNWIAMGTVSVSFSPIALLNKRPELQSAYDEIIEYLSTHKNSLYNSE